MVTPIKISVVIPVYNTGSYLTECLDSLVRQDLPKSEYEVIAVDDGSTDGSGDVLDRHAADHSNVRVIHQENSGWPGRPRNVGTDASTGEFVFYMDADDYMSAETLRRLHDFASTHGSDVVAVKLVAAGGRWQGHRPWRATQVDADPERLFLTLSPQKLFRRSFLDAHGLRFPEGKVRLEDGIFVAKAYVLASRVSIVADYDYYFLRLRESGGNISGQALPPEGYTGSIATIMDTIRELPDPAVADRIALDVYRRKALKVFVPQRFLNYQPTKQERWVSSVQQLAVSRVSEPLESTLEVPFRLRSMVARTGDVEAMRRLATLTSERNPDARIAGEQLVIDLSSVLPGRTVQVGGPSVRLAARLDDVSRRRDGLRLTGRWGVEHVSVAEQLGAELVLSDRQTGRKEAVAVKSGAGGDGWFSFDVTVPTALLCSTGADNVWDVLLRTTVGRASFEGRLSVTEARQAAIPLDAETAVSRGDIAAEPYRTVYGNLSVQVRPGGKQRLRLQRLLIKRARQLRARARSVVG